MQIKRIYRCFTRTMSMMLCCMLTFAACVNEEVLPSPGEQEQKMVNLSMEITNRSGVPGSDSEIKKVRIIAFDSRNGGLIYNNLIDNPSTMPVKIEMLSGTRDFYAITNEPSSQTAALENVRSLQHLQAIRIPYNEVEQGTTFVTFGTLPGKEIKPQVTNQIAIENKRLAVKVDLILNGKNFTPAESVTFSNLPDNIPLFEVPYEPAIGNSKEKTVTSLTVPGSVPAGYIWSRTATVVLPSYLFTPENNKDKAACIEVTQNTGKISAAIGHKASDNDYTLKRNHIYSLTAVIGSDELIIESQVKNWEALPQDYPAGGGSFWEGQPKDTRVGLNGTDDDATATFTAVLAPNGTDVSFKWYRTRQKANDDFALITEEVTGGVVNNNNASSLILKADGLEDACMVYCVATITAPDGRIDRLKSNYATFMPVGDWVQPEKTYPYMQNWNAPQNAPLGSTCLLQDERDKKVYRVKLMADGNWWMVQDLAYGDVSAPDEYANYSLSKVVTNKIKTGLYGVCKSSEIATGGYLYNSYAAIQLPQGTGTDHNNGVALKTEFIQGLCPDGWHLPGNMDNEFNKEWKIMQDALKWNVEVSEGIMKMVYNDAYHFNAYTLNKTVNADFNPIEAISFWGGYGSSVVSKVPTFVSLGFSANNLDNGTVMDPQAALVIGDGLSIRCLRNFK